MGGLSPETCWAIKKHWNNKFYYTFASCSFFLWDLYYDALIHEHQLYLHFNGSLLSVLTMGEFCFSIAEPLANALRDLKNVCVLEGPLLKPYWYCLLRCTYCSLEGPLLKPYWYCLFRCTYCSLEGPLLKPYWYCLFRCTYCSLEFNPWIFLEGLI